MQCPLLWFEQYHRLNPDGSRGRQRIHLTPNGADFGTREHELLAKRNNCLRGQHTQCVISEPKWPELEAEAQAMLEAYKAAYPAEEFEILDVERTGEVALGADHTYLFKIDLWARLPDGRHFIRDYKTEKRGSKANTPEAWAAKTQASLYLWAAEKFYGVRPDFLEVDILTRQSPKGEKPVCFRRYKAERTDAQRVNAAASLLIWADQIEDAIRWFGDAPHAWANFRNPNQCINETTGWQCDFYPPHIIGESPAHDKLYQIAERYLDL